MVGRRWEVGSTLGQERGLHMEGTKSFSAVARSGGVLGRSSVDRGLKHGGDGQREEEAERRRLTARALRGWT
jgi:hypothetical protein